MATRKLVVGETADGIVFQDVVTKAIAVQLDVAEIHKDLVDRVLRYGMKQIIADGGALPAGSSIDEKIDAMNKRANALRDGSWGTKRVSTAKIADFAIWVAVTNLGLIEATEGNLTKWNAMKAAQRAALLQRKDVAKAVAEQASGEESAATLDAFR